MRTTPDDIRPYILDEAQKIPEHFRFGFMRWMLRIAGY